jgi:hypothetical protein
MLTVLETGELLRTPPPPNVASTAFDDGYYVPPTDQIADGF